MSNLDTCIRCPQSRTAKTPENKVACAADPARRSVSDIADAYECPLGLFKPRGLGDVVKSAMDRTGVGPAVKRVIRKVTGKPCNCGKRQKAWNAAVPFKQP